LQSPGHIFPVALDQPQASETRYAVDAIDGEEIARYGDLGHLDGDMARMTDDLGDQYVFMVFVWRPMEVFVRRFVVGEQNWRAVERISVTKLFS
jgi:hypothetical protein